MSSLGNRVVECPHCFGRVIAMSDNRCPACWEDTRLQSKSERQRVQLKAGAKGLPDVCVICGHLTSRRRKLTDWTAQEVEANPAAGPSPLAIVFGMLVPFGRLIHLVDRGSPSSRLHHKIAIKIPQCQACRKEEVRVLHANHRDGTIVIAAHERFCDALNAAA